MSKEINLKKLKPFVNVGSILSFLIGVPDCEINNLEHILVQYFKDDFKKIEEFFSLYETKELYIISQSINLEKNYDNKFAAEAAEIIRILKEKKEQYEKELKKKRKELIEYLLNEIQNNNNWEINISAPPSFGKSYSIIEVIKEEKKKNQKTCFVIICPTIALINEYVSNFENSSLEHKYEFDNAIKSESNIIISTIDKIHNIKKEQVDQYKDYKFCVFIDEFYTFLEDYKFKMLKIFLMNLKTNNNVVKVIKFSPHNVKYEESLTDFEVKLTRNYDIEPSSRYIHNHIFYKKEMEFRYWRDYQMYSSDDNLGLDALYPYKTNKLDDGYNPKQVGHFINYLWKNKYFSNSEKKEKLLIVSSKKNTYTCLKNGKDNLVEDLDISGKKYIGLLIEYINCLLPDEKIQKNYWLLQLLKSLWKTDDGKTWKIAYHNGSMDKIMRYLIEQAYKNDEIDILFATSTISKGVNLNPTDIIYFNYDGRNTKSIAENFAEDENKGIIRTIEIKNTLARTGRTNGESAYLGNIHIYRFKTEKDKLNKNELPKYIKEINKNEEKVSKKEEFHQSIFKNKGFKNIFQDLNKILLDIKYKKSREQESVIKLNEEYYKKFAEIISKIKLIKDDYINNLKKFVTDIYIKFLENIDFENASEKIKELKAIHNNLEFTSFIYEFNNFLSPKKISYFERHRPYLENIINKENNIMTIDEKMVNIYDMQENTFDYSFLSTLRMLFELTYDHFQKNDIAIDNLKEFDEKYEITIEKEKNTDSTSVPKPFGVDKMYNRSPEQMKKMIDKIFQKN